MLNGIPSLIVGNLARDPEFQTVNGKQIARISIGVTPRVKKGGDWQDAPPMCSTKTSSRITAPPYFRPVRIAHSLSWP